MKCNSYFFTSTYYLGIFMTFTSKLNLLPILALGTSAMLMMSSANALDIKQEMVNSCVKQAVNDKIADKANASKLCSCTADVQSKMTVGQMWEAESYAKSGKNPITLPYIKKMQQDMQKCSKGLKINNPSKAK